MRPVRPGFVVLAAFIGGLVGWLIIFGWAWLAWNLI